MPILLLVWKKNLSSSVNGPQGPSKNKKTGVLVVYNSKLLNGHPKGKTPWILIFENLKSYIFHSFWNGSYFERFFNFIDAVGLFSFSLQKKIFQNIPNHPIDGIHRRAAADPQCFPMIPECLRDEMVNLPKSPAQVAGVSHMPRSAWISLSLNMRVMECCSQSDF